MARRVRVAPGQRVTLPSGAVLSGENELVLSDADFTAVASQVTAGSLVDLGSAEITTTYTGMTAEQHAALDHTGVPGAGSPGQMFQTAVTTNATPVTLAVGGVVADGNVLAVAPSQMFSLRITVAARRTDGTEEVAGWTWDGVIARAATGPARIVGTPLEVAWGDLAADPWAMAVAITNNGSWATVQVTGEAAKNVRWTAKLEWVES